MAAAETKKREIYIYIERERQDQLDGEGGKTDTEKQSAESP